MIINRWRLLILIHSINNYRVVVHLGDGLQLPYLVISFKLLIEFEVRSCFTIQFFVHEFIRILRIKKLFFHGIRRNII